MVAKTAKVHERVRPVALHRHDAQVPAEVSGVAPADGQPVPLSPRSEAGMGATQRTGGVNHRQR